MAIGGVDIKCQRFENGLTWLTLRFHNFGNIGPFLTKPVPMESCERDLSFETGSVKNGPMSTKL